MLDFLASVPVFLVIDRIGLSLGLYRLVWHPPLVRLALFVGILFGLGLFSVH